MRDQRAGFSSLSAGVSKGRIELRSHYRARFCAVVGENGRRDAEFGGAPCIGINTGVVSNSLQGSTKYWSSAPALKGGASTAPGKTEETTVR